MRGAPRPPWRNRSWTLPLILVLAALPTPIRGQDAAEPVIHRIGATYDFTWFDDSLTPWHETAVQVSRKSEAGSLIARLNHARRFDAGALQLELDAYPRLGKGRYAFLNVGYAGDRLFPSVRVSGEVWQNLPGSFEMSAGARYMRFSRDVTLFTGSVGHYRGNYWYSVRPWLRSRDGEISASANLSVRRYRTGRDDYFGAVVGFGSGVGDFDTPEDLNRLSSFKLGLEGRLPFREMTWVGKWSAGVEWEEVVGGRQRTRASFGLGFDRVF